MAIFLYRAVLKGILEIFVTNFVKIISVSTTAIVLTLDSMSSEILWFGIIVQFSYHWIVSKYMRK